jgi:hypothetical protein
VKPSCKTIKKNTVKAETATTLKTLASPFLLYSKPCQDRVSQTALSKGLSVKEA